MQLPNPQPPTPNPQPPTPNPQPPTLCTGADAGGLTTRQRNIAQSPKVNGSAGRDSEPYLRALGKEIVDLRVPIQFNPNSGEAIHRWAPYVQGFSSAFVDLMLDRHAGEYANPTVLDPFAGCGTVLVQSKRRGLNCCGVEINPLMHFVTKTKLANWGVKPESLLMTADAVKRSVENKTPPTAKAPSFLKSEKHFNPRVRINLERILSAIDQCEDKPIRALMRLAFSAILVDCSGLKRSPCLGYAPGKKVTPEYPVRLFMKKIGEMAEDLREVQKEKSGWGSGRIIPGNSMEINHDERFDLVITSPPYMNGLDYVMNYKIEMAWLGHADNSIEMKGIKDAMVVCDNVSKGLIRNFAKSARHSHEWVDAIKSDIAANIQRRGGYRREDMPEIIHKYFDDMWRVMERVAESMNPGGRFIQVVGDSLIADCYIPTDLILARIGQELGLELERIEKARDRRSGQVRSYVLRETIITMKKTRSQK